MIDRLPTYVGQDRIGVEADRSVGALGDHPAERGARLGIGLCGRTLILGEVPQHRVRAGRPVERAHHLVEALGHLWAEHRAERSPEGEPA